MQKSTVEPRDPGKLHKWFEKMHLPLPSGAHLTVGATGHPEAA
jgi:hypothetical protein